MRDPGRVVIIGAGPTGLAAGHRLHELGHNELIILDGRNLPGGLATSYLDPRGFTWDVGGHVQFSHYESYDRLLEKAVQGEWIEHRRSAWIWFKNRFIPYPFQNNLGHLDEEDRHRCLQGLEAAIAARSDGEPRNFREWIDRTFGTPIADLVLAPLNLKTWGYPLEWLGTSWVSDRVAVPDIERIRESIRSGQADDRWGPNQVFRYPKRGGTGAIWKGVAGLMPEEHLRLGGYDVVAVDASPRAVVCGNGSIHPWDTLISTMPLDALCRSISDLPTPCRRAAEALRHSSIHVIGIGLRDGRPSALDQKSWMYFPMGSSPYFRATVFSNYSPFLVPEEPGHWSLMCEVCESPFRPVERETVVAEVIRALGEDGLIPVDARIVSTWYHREEYGYPTPTVGRDEALGAVMFELEKRNIFSRGRFGGWKYEVSNQDHSAMTAIELVDRLLLDKPESTYTFTHTS